MRRLYLQVYSAFVGILLLFALLVGAAWHLRPSSPQDQQMLEGLGGIVAELLPARATPAELQRTLERLEGSLAAELTLWSADGQRLAAVGEPLPFPGHSSTRSTWLRARGGFAFALQLADGRWLAVRHRRQPRHAGVGLLLAITLFALAVAVGAYPLARRLTRRLERLRAAVEGLGSGNLRSRVPVEGQDEVAALARSFNLAGERIESLVGAQRTLLASASHELRSPLARIRVALELLGAERPALSEKVAADIALLDELIEELLLASRLETVQELGRPEELDLLGLLAEEAARCNEEIEVGGQPEAVSGDLRLLRRLVRNLLENALRHGRPPIEARVEAQGQRVLLRVLDRGPGVPEAERERIFAPFYRPAGASPESGAGLGLALVRQIARRHGGEARCLEREGGGCCFEVELPRSSAAAAG